METPKDESADSKIWDNLLDGIDDGVEIIPLKITQPPEGIYFDENYWEKWIAFNDGGLVGADPSLKDLLDDLETRGVTDFTTEYLPTPSDSIVIPTPFICSPAPSMTGEDLINRRTQVVCEEIDQLAGETLTQETLDQYPPRLGVVAMFMVDAILDEDTETLVAIFDRAQEAYFRCDESMKGAFASLIEIASSAGMRYLPTVSPAESTWLQLAAFNGAYQKADGIELSQEEFSLVRKNLIVVRRAGNKSWVEATSKGQAVLAKDNLGVENYQP